MNIVQGIVMKLDTELAVFLSKISSKKSITLSDSNLIQLDSDSRPLFLKAISKASSLTLEIPSKRPLTVWTADEFEQFIDAVKQNKELTELTIRNSCLATCSYIKVKWNCLLELFSIPHLKNVDLMDNDFEKLNNFKKNELVLAVRVALMQGKQIDIGFPIKQPYSLPLIFSQPNLSDTTEEITPLIDQLNVS